MRAVGSILIRMTNFSRLGVALAGIYLVLSAFHIATQGIFGESFITILLGLPWTFLLSLIEYGGATGVLLYVLALLPILINAVVLYWVGKVLKS